MLTIENNVLVKCDENATEVVIPADITEIESTAFKVLPLPRDCGNSWQISRIPLL